MTPDEAAQRLGKDVCMGNFETGTQAEAVETLLAERERLREALSEEAVNRYLTERCGWSLEWDGHNTMRTTVVSTLRCFAGAVLAGKARP